MSDENEIITQESMLVYAARAVILGRRVIIPLNGGSEERAALRDACRDMAQTINCGVEANGFEVVLSPRDDPS